MPNCNDCGNSFPSTITLDGKRRDLRNRTKCFECLPFGTRNSSNRRIDVQCSDCGRNLKRMKNGHTLCVNCYQKQREQAKRNQVHKIVGESCWICGYGGKEKRQALDFHHVDPDQKSFALHTRNIANRSWKSVLNEIEKCCLLCCRCHREFEVGILNEKVINDCYIKKWKEIRIVS